MRFLIDECLHGGLAAALKNAGHDAIHLSDVGLLGAADPAVMAAADDQQRVLLSADTDFGELLATTRSLGPSVILFRGQSHDVAHLSRLVLAVLPDVEADLLQGAIVTIGRNRVRIRRLPIGG